MTWLELASAILTLIYLYYAIRNSPRCFYYAIGASSIWTYISASAGLYFDAGLQVFYVVMAVWGLYLWVKPPEKQSERPIVPMSIAQHVAAIVGGGVLALILSTLSTDIPGINYVGIDALTTVYLIIGTILLVYRRLESWIYLVVADIIYIYIYYATDLHILMSTMVVYTIFGIYGYLHWRRLMSHSTNTAVV